MFRVDAVLPCRGEVCIEPDAAALARVRLSQGEGGVTFVSDDPTRISLQVESASPDQLILADVDYPGWEAFVDGRPVPIEPAGVFRRLEVPAGSSAVDLRFAPHSFRLGLFLSLMGLSLWLAAGLTGWRREQARSRNARSLQ